MKNKFSENCRNDRENWKQEKHKENKIFSWYPVKFFVVLFDYFLSNILLFFFFFLSEKFQYWKFT